MNILFVLKLEFLRESQQERFLTQTLKTLSPKHEEMVNVLYALWEALTLSGCGENRKKQFPP